MLLKQKCLLLLYDSDVWYADFALCGMPIFLQLLSRLYKLNIAHTILEYVLINQFFGNVKLTSIKMLYLSQVLWNLLLW